MVGYIFYDTETTGLTAGFDQILQFAALVTDDDLNVVEEVDLRCRLQPHMLPSPGALVITGISPTDIAEAPLSHYEMVSAIRALIKRHSPTTLVGFNSLGYDEAMLRQAFYQTLNPVYLLPAVTIRVFLAAQNGGVAATKGREMAPWSVRWSSIRRADRRRQCG